MHAAKEETTYWEDLREALSGSMRAGVFWVVVSLTSGLFQGLMVATAVSVGVLRMCAIWVPILVSFLLVSE